MPHPHRLLLAIGWGEASECQHSKQQPDNLPPYYARNFIGKSRLGHTRGMESSRSSEWRSLVGTTVQRSRRSEFRYSVSGQVKIMLYEELGLLPAVVEGELVDLSRGGCRVSHRFGPLRQAQQVTLLMDSTERPAIVVWSKAIGDQHESGFSFVTATPQR